VFWFVYFYTPVYFESLLLKKAITLSGQDFGRNIPKFINKLLTKFALSQPAFEQLAPAIL
jgi:hypothetical protein